MHRAARLLTVLLALASAGSATAQPAYLVKDLQTGTYDLGSLPKYNTVFGSNVFFSACTTADGCELWKSNGTDAGTVMVKDIYPGSGSSNPHDLVVFGSYLYFAADDGSRGECLWRTDGTTNGTTLLKDLFPTSSNTSQILQILSSGGRLFIRSYYTGHLWVSDGTAGGTLEFSSSVSTKMVAFNGGVIYGGTDGTVSSGTEPVFCNGTSASLIKDIVPGYTSSNPDGFVVLGTKACFFATDPATGKEPWVTDGTAAGTLQLADIGAGAISSNPVMLGKSGSRVFFTATTSAYGTELYSTNGTPAGTALLKDIRSGPGSSSPASLIDLNGIALFNADDGVNGMELWRSDGTTAGTSMLKDLRPGSAAGAVAADSKTVIGNTVYFKGYASYDPGLWRTDGTAAGTVQIRAFRYSYPEEENIAYLVPLNGLIFFNAASSGSDTELWATDGTQTGTYMVKDIRKGYYSGNPDALANFGGTLLFGATTGSSVYGLWRSDGTNAGTTLVANGFAAEITQFGPRALFRGSGGTTGAELWITDGTVAGTLLLKDICSSPGCGSNGSYPMRLTDLNGTMMFVANDSSPGYTGQELWKSDGTTAGTTLVADINYGSASSSPNFLVKIGGTLFFSALEPSVGNELWKSDGTVAGTLLLKNIAPGSASGNPTLLTVAGATLFFIADSDADPYTPADLWKSDGTTAGTVKVAAIGSPETLVVLSTTQILFRSYTTAEGTELWKSDGTVAGTMLLKDINPGTGSSNPKNFTKIGTTMYFVADNGTTGPELWKTDGTVAGTVLVKDINPGPVGSFPSQMFNAGGKLLFTASDGTSGAELWVSDGTAAGTVLLQDMNPGPSGSKLERFTGAGTRIFFAADNGTNGEELWALPFSDVCTPPPAPVITRIPGADTTCSGQSVTLDAGAGYSSYLWSTTATTRSITVAPAVTTTYTAYGYNASGCPSAASCTQTVISSLSSVSISFGATSATTCRSGTAGTATATDSGGGTSTHQWGYRAVSGGSITNIAGATAASYTLNGAHFPSAGDYLLVVTTTPTCGTPTVSNELAVSVVDSLTVATISILGSASVFTTGTAGTVSLSTTGGGTISRSWGYRTVSGGTVTTIPGQTNPTYLVRGSDFPAVGTYYLVAVASPSCGTPKTSNEVAVTVLAPLAVPATFSAAAISTSQVVLSWGAVAGATGYDVYRNGALFTTTATAGYTDSGLQSSTTYLYNVRATCSAGASNLTPIDPATTIMFTDDPLNAGTEAKALHVAELRIAVNAMRAAAGLTASTFTDASLAAGMPILAIHVIELRTALDEARAQIGLTALSYTDVPIVAGSTFLKAAHFSELRNGVK